MAEAQKGLNIVKNIYEDGSVQVTKTISNKVLIFNTLSGGAFTSSAFFIYISLYFKNKNSTTTPIIFFNFAPLNDNL